MTEQTEPPLPIPSGWQCPVCGQVYSPFVSKCPEFHGNIKTGGATTNPWVYEPERTTGGTIYGGVLPPGRVMFSGRRVPAYSPKWSESQ